MAMHSDSPDWLKIDIPHSTNLIESYGQLADHDNTEHLKADIAFVHFRNSVTTLHTKVTQVHLHQTNTDIQPFIALLRFSSTSAHQSHPHIYKEKILICA